MAMAPDIEEYIKARGFDMDDSSIPDTPEEVSAASLRLFMSGNQVRETSVGRLHITGASVHGHSAPARALGELLSNFQKVVDAVGASIEGVTSLAANIPSDTLKRTELAVVASPIPGSVVIEIAPTMSREQDFRPDQEGLFDVEDEIDAHPLADLAIIELMDMIDSRVSNESVNQNFLGNLEKLGPKVSSAMKSFCSSIDDGGFDLDLKWNEPHRPMRRVAVTNTYAKCLVNAIEEASVDVELTEIVGVIETNTNSPKDKLRIKNDDGSESLVFIGEIDPFSLIGVKLGQRVRVKAKRQINKRPGGREGVKLLGVSIVPENQIV